MYMKLRLFIFLEDRMNKISVLCVNRLIDKLNNSKNIFETVQEISEWFSKSVNIIGELKSFDSVQRELINISHYIVEGKTLTKRGCNKLLKALTEMLTEMLPKIEIVLFVTPTVRLKFNKNIKVIIMENEEDCIDLAYEMREELKYLLCVNKDEVSKEFRNAVDIFIDLEELIKVANIIYPIDKFTYDRIYLISKLDKIEKEQSKILLTGDSYIKDGLFESKMPYLSSNVGINFQDLYYSLLSVKEAIIRSKELKTIIISCSYHFFFSNMSENPTAKELEVLSKVNYPIYKKLRGYRGKLLPIYNKTMDLPLYEAIVSFEEVRDIYYSALIKDLSQMNYYNKINIRTSYDFKEKTEEEKFEAGKIVANTYNLMFDLDKGLYNQKLLDKFLDNMEELDKKVILFVPPATKFYRNSVSMDMVNSYYQLLVPVVNFHKCCTFIDLFDSDKFSENDFINCDSLNESGANKLSEIISKYIEN